MYESFLKKLKTILSSENVFTDPETLEKYSKDQSFVSPCKPDFIVFVKNVKEIQEVVVFANGHKIPIIPFSSGQNFHGATIPNHGGLILDMSKMNKIIEIDQRNRFAVIEPGVTYTQLQEELIKRGFRIMVPLGVPPTRSVLSSRIEKDPVLAAASFEYGNDLFMDTEIVLPSGELFRTGSWSVSKNAVGGPLGPVSMLIYRLWMASQGTLGILTKMVVKIENLSKTNKVFFLPFDRIEDTIEPIQRIQRLELGMECFALSSFNLAAILTRDWAIPENFPCEKTVSSEFESLRERLPKWTLIVCLSGLPYFPKEKIAYEEADLKDVCLEVDLEPSSTVATIKGLGETIQKELLHPWGILKKFRYKGSVHDVSFYSPLNKVSRFNAFIRELADKHGYATENIGGYMLTIERGRSAYCEFDYYCDLDDPEETEQVKKLWLETYKTLADGGAFLAKLYGPIAEIVYRQTASTYIEKLRQLKEELDPNNIMNPGKLCF